METAFSNEQHPLIEFRGVSKTYNTTGTHALSDVNLRINKGEFVFVVGSSGAGKSTFMKLIMREEKANAGDVLVNGYNLTTMKRKDIPMLRRTMGIVFQDFRLIPTMNVFENVAFAMHVVGASSRKIRKEVARSLSKVGLGHKARSMPNELSGGEQQRVGLARALVNAPDLIIADEPTGNLDSHSGVEVMKILHELHEEGRTVILITHDNDIANEAQRVIRIQDGQIVSDVMKRQ